MPSKIQELARLIGALKKVLPQDSKAFATDPFTCLRVQVLAYITQNTSVGMNELAKFLAITPPSATSIVSKLVKAGGIARIADKSDRRKVLLTITPKGKKMLEKGKQHIEQHLGNIFSVLTNTELDQFIHIIKKLVETHSHEH